MPFIENFLNNKPRGIASSLLQNRPVADGEPVNAAVTNRLPGTNAANVAYLHSLVELGFDLSGEYLWDMPVADDVVIGDFVYFSATTRVFEKGLAQFTSEAGYYEEAESASVWGVVTNINSSNRANICTNGLCTFKPTTDVYKNQTQVGLRFLSSISRGEPTPEIQTPFRCLGYLIGVKQSGDVQFFVRPYLVADPRVHQHKSYELVPAFPSDSSEPGWFPIDDAMFSGRSVPPNAVYGYNPNFLAGIPLRFAIASGLRWQNPKLDPIQGFVPNELYEISNTDIWWIGNKDNIVPYDAFPLSEESFRFRMWLDIISVGFGLQDRIVSSLRAEPDSGLSIHQYPTGGNAISGDLIIDFNLRFNELANPNFAPYTVSKLTGKDVTLSPNVSGMRITSTRLKILSSDQTKDNFHYGRVTLGDTTGLSGQELPFEAIHLNAVEEAVEREAIGLAFPPDRLSSFLARISVPFDDTFDQVSLSLFFGILLSQYGNIAQDLFKLSYRIIRAASEKNTVTEAFGETGMTLLPCDFRAENTLLTTGYYTAESAKFAVKPGDTVFVKVARTPPDNYGDRIMLLRKAALVYLNDLEN
jgi:hypothetical protein